MAVRDALVAGRFLDGGWVERWDVVFAGLYLDALERWNRAEPPSAPWAVALPVHGRHAWPSP